MVKLCKVVINRQYIKWKFAEFRPVCWHMQTHCCGWKYSTVECKLGQFQCFCEFTRENKLLWLNTESKFSEYSCGKILKTFTSFQCFCFDFDFWKSPVIFGDLNNCPILMFVNQFSDMLYEITADLSTMSRRVDFGDCCKSALIICWG